MTNTYNKRQIGAGYERQAGAYLKEQGYDIVEYNYRCRKGEIDIIAREGDYLVFCEVKYRRNEDSGDPSEAVDIRKQRRISRCAAYYLMEKRLPELPCRFDVVSILAGETILIRNAFDFIG